MLTSTIPIEFPNLCGHSSIIPHLKNSTNSLCCVAF